MLRPLASAIVVVVLKVPERQRKRKLVMRWNVEEAGEVSCGEKRYDFQMVVFR